MRNCELLCVQETEAVSSDGLQPACPTSGLHSSSALRNTSTVWPLSREWDWPAALQQDRSFLHQQHSLALSACASDASSPEQERSNEVLSRQSCSEDGLSDTQAVGPRLPGSVLLAVQSDSEHTLPPRFWTSVCRPWFPGFADLAVQKTSQMSPLAADCQTLMSAQQIHLQHMLTAI